MLGDDHRSLHLGVEVAAVGVAAWLVEGVAGVLAFVELTGVEGAVFGGGGVGGDTFVGPGDRRADGDFECGRFEGEVLDGDRGGVGLARIGRWGRLRCGGAFVSAHPVALSSPLARGELFPAGALRFEG